MIKLEFVGDKPIITSHGVGFKAKHDKFIYIEPAAHLLKILLDFHNVKFEERIEAKNHLNNDEIFALLKLAYPTFYDFYKEHIEDYNKSIDKEIALVDENHRLSEVEKNTMRKNIESMRDYRLQRATNKLVYEEIIGACVGIIKEKKIDNIHLPFTMEFLHVLESIQTTLEREKLAPIMNLSVKVDHNIPYAELTITRG